MDAQLTHWQRVVTRLGILNARMRTSHDVDPVSRVRPTGHREEWSRQRSELEMHFLGAPEQDIAIPIESSLARRTVLRI